MASSPYTPLASLASSWHTSRSRSSRSHTSHTSHAEMQASADQMLNVPLTSSSSTARARTVLPSDTSTLGSSHERRTTQHSSASGSTRSTSSGTRERLRQTELERDDLRRAILKERTRASEMERLAKEKQAVAERVKREGNSTALDISAIDAKFRMLELERETRAAKAEKRAPAKGMFKAACSTDLLSSLTQLCQCITTSMRRSSKF
jgi:hypothetical protein